MKFSKFFSRLQEEPWYREFLRPVIHRVEEHSNLLDIGTGSGKLLEIICKEKSVKATGVDTSLEMLAEATRKLINTNARLLLVDAGRKLPFKKNTFDFISVCNVLFHIKQAAIERMLDEYIGLLKPSGKIIVLTPTGKGNIIQLAWHFLSLKNLGIFIWYSATKKRSIQWGNNGILKCYSIKNNLDYHKEITLKGFAVVETIQV